MDWDRPWEENWRIVRCLKPSHVFLVESRADGRRAVLKTRPQQSTDDFFLGDRFRGKVANECIALLRLHAAAAAVPGVVEHNLSAFDETELPLYFVSEYVEGPTLREYSKQHVATSDQLDQIAAVIHAAHGLGISHGDPHGENVIVGHDGVLWVVDWELGCHVSGSATPEQWRKAVKHDLVTVEALRNELSAHVLAGTSVGG